MVHAVGSGAASARGSILSPANSYPIYRLGDGPGDGLRPHGVSHRRSSTRPAPPHPISQLRPGRACHIALGIGSGADGPRESTGDAAGGGPKTWQYRGAGGSRSSYRWTSPSTVTGSFRGSYEELGEAPEGEDQEGEGQELGGPVKRVLALGSAAALELLLTGGLVWTPLAAAAVALVLMPGARALSAVQAAARQAEAVAAAEARVRAEMAARVPVSPPESGAWVGRLLGELWEPFVSPLVLSENLGHWADKVRRAAPPGLDLQLVEMSMGREAPRLSNFQVHADPATGRVTSIDCSMSFDSSSIRVVVVGGSSPVGRFTATITGISMRGRMRLIPVPDQRLILFSFREPPNIDPKLTLEGPFLGSQDIPPTALLRSLLAATLQDCLVEPVRGAISLDPEVLVGQPIDTTVNIYVESVQGITADGSHTATATAAATSGHAAYPSSAPLPQQQQPFPAPPAGDDPSLAAFLASLAAGQPVPAPAPVTGGSAGGGSTAAASVVAAASSAAVAAREAVAEGAGAIASLVPGLSSVAGGAAVEGGGRGSRERLLQVVAINTDSKLQRETRPVPYTPLKTPAKSSASGGSVGAPGGAAGAGVALPGTVIPVLQMLKLNVGHKDTIYKLLVKDVGRSAGPSGLTGGVSIGSGGGMGGGGGGAPSATSGASTGAAAASPSVSSSSGSTSAASSTPTSVAAAVVAGLPTPGLLGSVRLHVAAAKDGSTLFWAAREGGEPVAVRWRPSDGPWRITLPLESPTFGLPPPWPAAAQAPAAAAGPAAGQGHPEGSAPAAGGTATPPTTNSNTTNTNGILKPRAGGGGADAQGNGSSSSSGTVGSGRRGTRGSSNGDGRARASDGPAAAATAAGQATGGPTGRFDSGSAAATSAGPASATSGETASASSASSSAATENGASGAGAANGVAAGPDVAASPVSGTGQSVIPVGGASITLLVSTDPWVYADANPPGTSYSSARARSLVLQVVEARDLAARDWAGTCDPYVRISYDGRTYRTRTLYNAHTPVWQQTFILPDNRSALSSTTPPRNRMSLSVYDSGVSRDDRLGSATLNLDMASEHLLQDRWLPLQGADSGSLRVRLAAVPDTPDSAAVRRAVEALEGLTGGYGPLLQVVVLSVRALSPRRGGQLLGLRDAYCNIVYGGARHVTQVVRQNQNPRFDYSALFAMQPDEDVDTADEGDALRGAPPAAPEEPGEDASAPEHDTTALVGAAAAGNGNGGSTGSSNTTVISGSRAVPQQGKEEPLAGNANSPSRRNGPAAATTSSQGSLYGSQGRSASTGGGDGRIPPLPPYPPVPATGPAVPPKPPPPPSPPPAGAAAGRAPWQRPRPRFLRDRNRDVLRLEVKDVAPVPPDEDLGWVELPVRALLPEPGDRWQGWLPLRRGEGAEVLVRIARIQPLPLGQGPLRLYPEQPQRAGTGGGGGAAAAAVAAAGEVAAGAGESSVVAVGPPAANQQGVALMERVLLDSFTDQVRAANRAAGLMGDDLRVRLGQDVIPKIQDWWDVALQRTASTLETPGVRLSGWIRNQQFLPSAWLAGINAMSVKGPPAEGRQVGTQRKGLPAPPAAASALPPDDATQLGAATAEGQNGTAKSQRPSKLSEQSAGGEEDPSVSVGSVGVVEGGAAGAAPSADGTRDHPGGEVQGRGGATESRGQAAKEGDASRGSPEAGDAVSVKEAGGRKKWVGAGESSTSKAAVSGGGSGGLGQLLARAWEQLLGPPAYQPRPQAEARQQEAQAEPSQSSQQQQQQNDDEDVQQQQGGVKDGPSGRLQSQPHQRQQQQQQQGGPPDQQEASSGQQQGAGQERRDKP